jgi:tetratricopeptide (TPR) repeat protein
MSQIASRLYLQKEPVHEFLAKAMECHKNGALNKAEKYYKRVLKIDPNHVDALHLSGIIAHQLGRTLRAIKLIQTAIANDKNQAVFHNNLAIIYNKNGHWAEAEASTRRSLEICSNDGEAWGILGEALAGLGRISDAVKAYKKSITLKPGNAIVYCNLASLLTALGKFKEAEQMCICALELQPNLAKALHGLGVAQSGSGKLDKAEVSFKKALKLDPQNSQTMTNLASIYSAKLKYNEAILLFQKSIQFNPNSTEPLFNLGVCYSELGEIDNALTCFERTLEIDPDNVDAYYAIATSGKKYFSTEQMKILEKLLNSPTISSDKIVKINFALAWQADKRKLPMPAITFCVAGNKLRRKLLAAKGHTFDPIAHQEFVERVETVFTEDFFKNRTDFGIVTEQPVFVVGMPRSGTTLVEKIAASHRNIYGAGERNAIPKVVQKLEREANKKHEFPELISNFSKIESIELANSDLEMLQDLSGARRVIDKMPLNYLYLGLVALLYPQAKVIDCQRDPRDIAISCYFQNFSNIQPWSCDLSHIGVYFNMYRRMMVHWQKVLPLPILKLRYEDLVNNFEGKSREIIDFTGLDWDEECLKFYSAPSEVRTASKWQVRQPIYKSSVGRWKTFGHYMAPFNATLDVSYL